MRALKKEPGKPWVSVEIDNELKPLQKAVGGYLESFTFSKDACILCDEEGRLKGKPYNTTILGVDFVGTILMVGVDGEEFADLTEQREAMLRAGGIIP